MDWLRHFVSVEENLKTEQRFRLRDLLRFNLKTVRAYLLKEAFQQLWDYGSPAWAASVRVSAWSRGERSRPVCRHSVSGG